MNGWKRAAVIFSVCVRDPPKTLSDDLFSTEVAIPSQPGRVDRLGVVSMRRQTSTADGDGRIVSVGLRTLYYSLHPVSIHSYQVIPLRKHRVKKV